MKKLLAMIIALSCILCVFSCDNSGGDEGGNNNGNTTNAPEIPVSEGGTSFAEFVSATAAMSSIKTSVVKVKFISTNKGELESQFAISYNTDGSSTVTITKQRYGSIGEDYIVTEGPFTVECDKNGNYELDGVLTGNVIANGAYVLNLDQYKLYDARIEGNALYATVFSSDTADVLGVEIAATVSISVVVQNGKIATLSAEYVKNGEKVQVKCEYGF